MKVYLASPTEEDLSCWDGPPDEDDEDETNLKESKEGIEEKSSQNEDDFNLKIDETEKKQIENEAECSKVPELENKIVEEEAELTPLCEKSFPQNVRISVFNAFIFASTNKLH